MALAPTSGAATGCVRMDADRQGLTAGHLVALTAALTGAVILVVSLWLPWFALHLDTLTRGRITGAADAIGGAPLVIGGGLVPAALLPRVHPPLFPQAPHPLLRRRGGSWWSGSVDPPPAEDARAARRIVPRGAPEPSRRQRNLATSRYVAALTACASLAPEPPAPPAPPKPSW